MSDNDYSSSPHEIFRRQLSGVQPLNLPLTSEGEAEATSRSTPPEVAPAVPVALPLLKEALDKFEKAAIERSIARNALHSGEKWVWVSHAPLEPPKRRLATKLVVESDESARESRYVIESLFGDLERDKERLTKRADFWRKGFCKRSAERDELKRALEIDGGAGDYFLKTVAELRSELAAVQADRDRLAKDYDTLRRAINDNSGECSPGCNSYGHTEDCEYLDDAATMRIQQEKIDALRSELSALRSTSLTETEAKHALDQIPDNQCGWPPKDCPLCDSLRAKLRGSAVLKQEDQDKDLG